MCSEWPLIPLRDFVDLLAGFAFKSTGYSDGQDDVRLLRGDNIAPGRVRWDGVKRWSRENAVGLERYALEPGDVVLAMDRPWIPAGLKVAQVQAADTPSYLVQRVARIRPASREDCSFLFALLSTPEFESYIQNVTTGTAVPHISAKQILDFEFRLPPAYVRAKVGEIVAALNERITLLRETNTTLEAIAQALFKSWFVDFDPVHARARGEQPAGLAPEVAALFPDSFEESALGMIPRGWKLMQFGEFIDRQSVGKKYDQKSALEEGSVPILDQGKSGVIGFHNDKPSVCASLVSPVVVFANHTCYMRLITFDFSAIQNVLPFIGKGVDTVWAFYATKDRVKFSEYKGHWPEFVIQKTIVPNQELTEVFRNMVDPLICSMRNNELQAQTLANLRDTLLPRLISGQLRLPEAEAMVEGAS
ncbi:restriction endonuclease subunit S [Aeromonas taiwanensis]